MTCCHVLQVPHVHVAHGRKHALQSHCGIACHFSRAARGSESPDVSASGHNQHLSVEAH